MEQNIESAQKFIAQATINFLAKESSLQSFYDDLKRLDKAIKSAKVRSDLVSSTEKLELLSTGLDTLTETVSGLTSTESTVRTTIIERLSALFSLVNQTRAKAQNSYKAFGYEESLAQFSAQFKLLTQTTTSALSLSTTPERCEQQLAKLLDQLQELESQFSEHDEFLVDILSKREEIFEAFESHKQRLLEDQQRKAQTLYDAAVRIVDGVRKRSQKFKTEDQLNTFFAADSLFNKLKQLSSQLRDLGDPVKADDIDALVKSSIDQAQRSLRDKADIYEEDGNVIKLGPRHRFSVNRQELDLTLLPRGNELYYHLTGTDYYERCDEPRLEGTAAYWAMTTAAESDQVSRVEYLAYSILHSAEQNTDGLSLNRLKTLVKSPDKLNLLLREYTESRYKEGYERGIHDHDAAKILQALVPNFELAGLLRFDPLARAWACVYWAEAQKGEHQRHWPARAQSAYHMVSKFGSNAAFKELVSDTSEAISEFLTVAGCDNVDQLCRRSSEYLIYELAQAVPEFVTTRASQTIVEGVERALVQASAKLLFDRNLEVLQSNPGKAWRFVSSWVQAWLNQKDNRDLDAYAPEAVAKILVGSRIMWAPREHNLMVKVEGLLSSHSRILQGCLTFHLDEYLLRLEHHCGVVVPAFLRYLSARQQCVETRKKGLRLEQYKASPLSSFVRNKLINQAYLPIIGANLAKQIGTAGQEKRSDLMGLLMMISPPGYGKTTLMEYVANRLGLIFMKINCPSLGHEVDSLDPQQAPNATARQELEKLNLGLEMGNNVMLYLDDIQHTNPEFLQKFISLCDGTRRIDGVWKGITKTYDMRGKKFCVVMAGNPYTESGEVFKIPDMLANRADIYNLGDVLSGTEEEFALSYIENAMTSNSVLAPLATRDLADFYKFVDMARGRPINDSDFKHPYSASESREIVETLKKLFQVQALVLTVNQQYIHSAAQDERFRVEPPFKLQGSYRNMNKLAEKVTAVMSEDELNALLDDHYLGEAQLLTSGTEANLLKLKELRGLLDSASSQRWAAIKHEFQRLKQVGGDDTDIGTRIVSQLNAMATSLEMVKTGFMERSVGQPPKVEVINQPHPGLNSVLEAMANTLQNSIFPLVKAMDGKIDLDLKTHSKMNSILELLTQLQADLGRSNHSNESP